MTSHPEEYPLMQNIMPREALQHDFILYIMFALTSLDLAVNMAPTEADASSYIRNALDYHSSASSGLNIQLHARVANPQDNWLMYVAATAHTACHLALYSTTRAGTAMSHTISIFDIWSQAMKLGISDFDALLTSPAAALQSMLRIPTTLESCDANARATIARLHDVNDALHDPAAYPEEVRPVRPIGPALDAEPLSKHEIDGSLYIIKGTPAKNKGAFAARNIPKGTRILAEKPLLTQELPTDTLNRQARYKTGLEWIDRLREKVDALTPAQLEIFNSIHHPCPDDEDLGLMAMCLMQLDGSPKHEAGIFPEALKFNHSCLPNTNITWNEKIKRMTISALRDIPEGEEITIVGSADSNMCSPRAEIYDGGDERRAFVRTRLGIDCACDLCSLPEGEGAPLEKLLFDIWQLKQASGEGKPAHEQITGKDAAEILENLHRKYNMILLIDFAGINDVSVWYTYVEAFVIVAKLDVDRVRAGIFIQRAVTLAAEVRGYDHSSHIELLPLAYRFPPDRLHGAEPPGGLDSGKLEAWLWKLEPTVFPPAQKLVNIRTSDFFPSFEQLPWALGGESEAQRIAKRLAVRKHWMLIGEVVEVDFSSHTTRASMVIEDKAGQELPLEFHVEHADQGLGSEKLCVGWTVVVMYAERKQLSNGNIIVMVTKPRFFKVLPTGLNSFLSLNDEVQKYGVESNEGVKSCHGCDEQSASLKKCAGCQVFGYCNHNCQLHGWLERYHKQDCREKQDMRLLSIALSLFATISHASATYNKAVEWTPCDFEAEAGLPVECGNLTVPLDYTSPDDLETLVLQLVRIPTASKTKKGSVLLNFGGPGEEGRLTLASTAFLMQT
ncbi:hypothetical protein ACHAQH_007577 [Verticillium albo-atrum]